MCNLYPNPATSELRSVKYASIYVNAGKLRRQIRSSLKQLHLILDINLSRRNPVMPTTIQTYLRRLGPEKWMTRLELDRVFHYPAMIGKLEASAQLRMHGSRRS